MAHRYAYKHWRKTSGWRGLTGLIWPLGLAILFITGAWWPGILILVGLSMVADTVGRVAFAATSAAEPETGCAHKPSFAPPNQPGPPPVARSAVAPVWPAEPPPATFDLRGLPNTCPQCGGPLSPKTTRPVSANLAECPWCASRLPLS